MKHPKGSTEKLAIALTDCFNKYCIQKKKKCMYKVIVALYGLSAEELMLLNCGVGEDS